MMNKKQFIDSQKDCASMLKMTLNDYQESTKKVLVRKPLKTRRKFDNSILSKLGLTPADLKTKGV